MTEFQNLETKFTADTSNFVGGVKKMQDKMGDASKSSDEMGASVGKLSKSFRMVGASAGGVVLALGAVGLAFDQAAKRAKELNKILLTANRTGMNPQTFQRLSVAAKKFGVEGDTVADAMKDLSERIADAAANGGSYEEALNRIGLSGKELIGLGLEEQFLRVGGAIGELETQADKAFVSMELMADGGYELINMFDAGEEGIRKMAGEAERLGAVLGDESLENVAELTSSYDNLLTAMEGAANQLVADMSPALADVADIMTDVILGMRGITAESAEAQAKMQAYSERLKTAEENLQALALAQTKLNEANRAGDIAGYDAAMAELQTTINGIISAYEEMAASGQETVALVNVTKRQVLAAKRGREATFAYGNAMSDFGKQLKSVGIDLDDLNTKQQTVAGGYKATVVSINEVINALRNLTAMQNENTAGAAQDKASASPFPEGVQAILDELALANQTEAEMHQKRIDRLNEHRQKIQDAMARQMNAGQEINAGLLQQDQELADAQVAIQAQKDAAIIAEEERAAQRRKMIQAQLAQGLSGIFGNISAAMNKENKKQFEVAKQAQTAQAIVNTYQAATGAYAAMASIPVVGPSLGVAAAAAAVAAGMANVSAIQSTSFGGGGGGGAAGGGAVASSGEGTVADGALSNRDITQFDINLQGQSIYGADQIDALIGAINDRTDDNVELRANVS